MATASQLELYTSELAAAAKTLADYCQDTQFLTDGSSSAHHFAVPLEAPSEVHRARRDVLASIGRIQTLLTEPADFIQRLASQTQLVACLQWLGEFHVLACIPLSGSVPARDVADLAGVPETQLCRIVRMTATAGFLSEPQPGMISHTALSAPFVTRLSYLDAAMFLAETAAPSALHMAAATQRHDSQHLPGQRDHTHHILNGLNGTGNGVNGGSRSVNGDTVNGSGGGGQSAYRLAFKTAQTFQAACDQRTKLQRQWPAYLRCAGDMEDSVAELLGRLDWHSLGNACIVDVDANSTVAASALAEQYPALHFVVQMSDAVAAAAAATGRDLSPRITVQQRAPGSLQSVKDAAVYILGLGAPYYSSSPSSSPPPGTSSTPGAAVNGGPLSLSAAALSGTMGGSEALPVRILAELRAHLGVLRANTSATLVLAPRLLPEPGTVDPGVEAMARVRDLSLLQLANEREMEMAELVEMVNSLRDSLGRLVVVNKLRSRNSATVALGIKYQPFAESVGGGGGGGAPHDVDPLLL